MASVPSSRKTSCWISLGSGVKPAVPEYEESIGRGGCISSCGANKRHFVSNAPEGGGGGKKAFERTAAPDSWVNFCLYVRP